MLISSSLFMVRFSVEQADDQNIFKLVLRPNSRKISGNFLLFIQKQFDRNFRCSNSYFRNVPNQRVISGDRSGFWKLDNGLRFDQESFGKVEEKKRSEGCCCWLYDDGLTFFQLKFRIF